MTVARTAARWRIRIALMVPAMLLVACSAENGTPAAPNAVNETAATQLGFVVAKAPPPIAGLRFADGEN